MCFFQFIVCGIFCILAGAQHSNGPVRVTIFTFFCQPNPDVGFNSIEITILGFTPSGIGISIFSYFTPNPLKEPVNEFLLIFLYPIIIQHDLNHSNNLLIILFNPFTDCYEYGVVHSERHFSPHCNLPHNVVDICFIVKFWFMWRRLWFKTWGWGKP